MFYKLFIDNERFMAHIYKNGTLHKSEIVRHMHLNIVDCYKHGKRKLHKYSYSVIPSLKVCHTSVNKKLPEKLPKHLREWPSWGTA